MTTALDLITDALVDIGVIEVGEVPEGAQSERALRILNDLIAGLSNDHLMIFTDSQAGYALNGATSYTIGIGANFDVVKPMKITSAFYRLSNIDYPVEILTIDEYDSIPFKTNVSSVVSYIYVSYNTSTGWNQYPQYNKIYVYPAATSGTLFLTMWRQIEAIATLNDTLILPNGYERMLRLGLSVELMPSYGMADQTIMALYNEAKAGIKRVNNKTKVLTTNTPISGNNPGGGIYRIQRGY